MYLYDAVDKQFEERSKHCPKNYPHINRDFYGWGGWLQSVFVCFCAQKPDIFRGIRAIRFFCVWRFSLFLEQCSYRVVIIYINTVQLIILIAPSLPECVPSRLARCGQNSVLIL